MVSPIQFSPALQSHVNFGSKRQKVGQGTTLPKHEEVAKFIRSNGGKAAGQNGSTYSMLLGGKVVILPKNGRLSAAQQKQLKKAASAANVPLPQFSGLNVHA